MSSSVIENIVAQENISPESAEQVVKNADAYKSTTAQEAALFDLNLNTQKENHDLSNIPGWDIWISNPYRASEFRSNETERLRGLYDLSKQPLYQSLAQKYGQSLAYKTDIILGHTRQTGWAPYRAYSSITNNLNQMRVADYENRLSKARTAGDTEEVAKLEEELAHYKFRAAYGPQPYESEGWNSASAFVASMVRNPEVLVLSALAGAAVTAGAPLLAGAGLATGATGVSLGTAAALKTTALADIYADTRNLTLGTLVPQIMEENPGMTEEEARNIAADPAAFAGLVEVFADALGTTVRGGAMVGSSRVGAKLATRLGLQKTGTQAIRDMPEFARNYLRSQMPKKFSDYAKEYGSEVVGNTVEEFLQQAAEETALRQAKTGESFSEAYANRLIEFAQNPEAPENAELLKTIRNTLFGAGVVSGVMNAPGGLRTLSKNRTPTLLQRSNQATNNMSFAQQLFDWRQKNPVAKESPETDAAHSQALVDRGIAPKKVRIDRKTAMEVLKDPNMQEAVKELELDKAVAESEENGGVIEVDFVKYDAVVNNNKELFQRVSSGISFIENALTVNEFIEHLNSLDSEALSEIKKAKEKADSVYNQVYEQQMQMEGMDEKVARTNAITAQLISNRIGAFKVGQALTGEQVFKGIEIRPMTEEEAVSGKTLDNLKQSVNIQEQTGAVSEQTGVTNGQRKPSSTETANAIRDAISAASEGVEPSGQRGSSVLRGRIWNDAGRGTKGSSKAKGVRILKINPKSKAILEKAGIDTKNLTVLDGTVGENAQTFHDAIAAAKAKLGEKAASVDVKDVSEYKEMKVLILSEDRQTGVAVKNNGDVVSVFNSNTERPGGIYSVLRAAIENGGNKLDCFDTFLPRVYSRVGFKAVARNNWVEMYKPEGWDKEFFNEFNNGEPDVVFMVYDPAYYESKQEYKRGEGELINTDDTDADYNAGAAAQDKALEAQQKGALFQTEEDRVAGVFRVEDGKLVIGLTPNANPSTLSHEMFHWFSHEMQKAFNSGEMTDYWKKQVKNLARTVGAKIEDGKLTLTEAQEEKAANMFLLYIKEGKVQNREIAPLFSYMQELFHKIWGALKISGKLSKQSEELFDSIFRAQDLIEHEQRMAGLLPIEKPDGADQGLYDMYVGEMLTSRMKATQELVRKREGLKKFMASKQYEALRDTVKAAISKTLSNKVEYRIKEIAAQNDNNPLQTFMAIQENPELAQLELPVEQIEYILKNTPDLSEAVEQETERQMLDTLQRRSGLTPEQIGYDETRNTAKVRALLAEALMRGGKTVKDFEAEYKKILAAADKQVNKTEIRKLKKDSYWAGLETKIVEDYIVALGKKNNNAMARARRDQAIVNAIRIKAKVISNRFDRFVDTAKKFEGAQQKIVHKNEKEKNVSEYKYTAEAYDLMQSILEKFGFYVKYARRSPRPVGEKLYNWVDNQEATTMTKLGALKNYVSFINEGYSGELDQMTGGQFDKLSIVFDAVKSVAGGEYSVMLKSEQVFFSDMVEATRENFKSKGLEAFQKPDNWWTKNFGTLGKWTNPEAILRAIFPPQVMDNIFLPFIDAAVRAEKEGNEWVNRYRLAKSKVDISNTLHTYSTGHTLSNKEVADLLLSMGNQHAYDNFRISLRNLTEQEAETIVSEALKAQPELANFAKEVWATYDTATKYLETEFETRTNTLFIKKDHRSFTINGIEFGGGYVPARKSFDFIPTDARAKNVGGMVHDKKFEKNIYAEADGNVLSIVDITENELYQSAKQGLTAVEYNNVQKFLKQDGVKDTIGSGAFDFITDWLTVYQAPYVDTSAWIRPLAQLSTTAALGFRAATMILQLSGVFQAAIELGPTYFARGLAQAMRNGEWAPRLATRKGADKSDYMSSRINDPRSSLLGRSVVDAVRMQDAKTQAGKAAQAVTKGAGDLAMAGIQYFDTIVANITWNGAYKRALDKGKSEAEARRDADSVVRVVQSDAMQISRPTVMQSQLARTVTAFSTWILAMRSQLVALTGSKQYGTAFVWATAYMVASPLFEAFLKESINMMYGDDDDDKDYLEKVRDTWYNQIVDTIGSAFIPAANLGAGATKAIAAGIELGFTDENEIFKLYQSNIPALQTAGRLMRGGQYGIAGAISGDSEKLKKAAIQASTALSSEGGKIVKMLLAD